MEWISVKERLPDYDDIIPVESRQYAAITKEVNICVQIKESRRVVITTGYYDNEWILSNSDLARFYPLSGSDVSVTHWMSLPEPPKL